MDLWDSYSNALALQYGQGKLYLSTGQRQHASIAQVADRAVELEQNRVLSIGYSDAHRYVIARDVSYGLLMSLYDVNTRSIVAMRISKDPAPTELKKLFGLLSKLKDSNLELRAIGLQNGYAPCNRTISLVHGKTKAKLMEADLFGTELRHIVIDTKTGVPYNLLLLNRIYRPGELVCQLKADEYTGKDSELVFV